jgi:hypothetical protein
MTSHNLALKTSEERKLVELDKQAALAIHRFKRGDITRYDIDMQIAKLDDQDKQTFKDRLNHHKNSGLSKSKQESV